jgi:regulator of replication initiation timing
LPPNDTKDEIVRNWLSESATDLECADLLYSHRLFSRALYHLQQSNEKLTKGLLLSVGILTPKTAKKDWRAKSYLGFLPKEPRSYRHRTLPSLLSDVDKTVPSIENFLTLLESGEFNPRITEFHETIRTSKKGVQKLKKKPFSLVETAQRLDIEIKGAQAVLDAVDQTANKINQELDKLGPQEMMRVATSFAQKAGFNVDAQPLPSFHQIKEGIIPTLRFAMLVTLSASMASILDPLESVTRYPDSRHDPFDENHPYVIHFRGLYHVVAQCLEKSKESKNDCA